MASTDPLLCSGCSAIFEQWRDSLEFYSCTSVILFPASCPLCAHILDSHKDDGVVHPNLWLSPTDSCHTRNHPIRLIMFAQIKFGIVQSIIHLHITPLMGMAEVFAVWILQVLMHRRFKYALYLTPSIASTH